MQGLWKYGLLILALVFAACASPNTPGPSPSFSLEPALQTLEVVAGDQTSLWVALSRAAGFKQAVQMRLEGLPDGVEQIWSRDTANGDCSLALKLDPEVAPGEYTINLVGETEGAASSSVSPAATSQKSITLKVSPAVQLPSLSLVVNPAILSLKRNSVGSINIQVVRRNGFSGDFSVQVAGTNNPLLTVALPSPISDGVNNATFTFSAAADATPGTLLFNFKAIQFVGGVNKVLASVPVQIKITEEVAPPSVELVFSPLSGQIQRGHALTGFIGLIRHNLPDPIEFKLIDPTGDISANFIPEKQGPGFDMNLSAKANAALSIHPITLQAIRTSNGEVLATRSDMRLTVVAVSGEADFFFNNTQQISMPSGFQAGKGMFVQQDKKIVFGGTLDGKFSLQRRNPDGSPDTSFGNAGTATANFGGSAVKLNKIARDPFDGGIMAVGFFQSGTGIAVARFTKTGILDSGFSDDGLLSSSFMNTAQDVLSIRGNVFAIVGSTSGTNTECRIFVLTRSATPDTSFSGDGQQAINPTISVDTCNAGVSAGTGLVVAGTANKGLGNDFKFFLARLDDKGALDEGFGDKGQVITDVNDATDVVTALLRQNNGKLVAGGLGPKPVLARYNANGTLDTTFGGNKGVVNLFDISSKIQSGEVTDMVIDTSNRILVATAGGQLIRLNSLGGLDASFATDGILGPGPTFVDIALEADGRILLLGDSQLKRLFP